MEIEKNADLLKSIFKTKNSMILYIDEAENSKTSNAATVQFFNAETKGKHWNSDKYIDVIDAKLFAIEKAIKFCANKAYSVKITSNIWIFTDCVNVITQLEKLEFWTHLMQKMHRNYKMLYEIDHKIHIHWILKHLKISKNVQIDKQAKKRLKKSENSDNFMSFQYLNKRIENDKFEKWIYMWQDKTKKSKYYKLQNSNSQQTFFQNFSTKN